ncbi:unnamed protein product [Symbiodinium pilosum]|uniref:Uncharacterized protein n=1 Tax=Symbiodinium pilosum TaxID=2952 RepID=A0A812LKM2_SYMPI|nr:unnamed protein product [Symbiodinium pilosum]
MLAQSIEEAANALQRFIAARGGSIRSSQLHEFRERYPSLAKVIYSKGTLQQFCQQHATFIVEESATMPGCTIRLRSAQPHLAQRLSQVAGSEGEGSIIADLASFVRENGGTASSEQFGSFYSRYPSHRASIPNLRAFCERYAHHFIVSQACIAAVAMKCQKCSTLVL